MRRGFTPTCHPRVGEDPLANILSKRIDSRLRGSDAFTLIELSIVLVIIGLLVGGVLVGQDLIRAAELRKVLSEIESFNAAAITFETTYDCMAGDCASATQFFAADPVCPRVYGTSPTESTCNGNGDGKITYATASDYFFENYLFWQHLNLGKLISGGLYSGVHCNYWLEDCGEGPNKNVYKSGSGIGSISIRNFVSAPNWDFVHNSEIVIGEPVGAHYIVGRDVVGNASFNPTFTPTEAFSMDQKMDDGKPGIGNVRMFKSDVPDGYGGPHVVAGCTTTDVASTSEYNVTNTEKSCALIVKAQF